MELVWRDLDEGSGLGSSSGGQWVWDGGGDGGGWPGGAWRVHVAEEPWRGGVGVLLEGGGGVLGVGSAEVKVRAAGGGGDLCGQKQTGLQDGLRVNIWLAESILPLDEGRMDLLDSSRIACQWAAWFGPEVRQVDISFASINNRVGIFTSSFRCTFIHHSDKAVSSGFARLSVRYDHRFIDVAESLEVFAERRVCRVIRQTADEDLGESRVFLNTGIHCLQRPIHELM